MVFHSFSTTVLTNSRDKLTRTGESSLKNVELKWIIVGGVVILIFLGLAFDMWRTFSVKRHVETSAVDATEKGAELLPFEPVAARAAAMGHLEKEGIDLSKSSVQVLDDGMGIEVDVYTEATAYFAWIVGNPSLAFGAKARGDVQMGGGGSVVVLPASDVAFGIANVPEIKPNENVLVWPATPEVPEFAAHGYKINRSGEVRVGETVNLTPSSSLGYFSSNETIYVVILTGSGENTAEVAGFGAFVVNAVDDQNRVHGRLVKKYLSGTPPENSGAEHSYGLYRGGERTVDVRLVRGSE